MRALEFIPLGVCQLTDNFVKYITSLQLQDMTNL